MGTSGFCPKCGAVMHNGVCASCGYGKREVPTLQTEQSVNQPVQSQVDTGGRFSGNMGSYEDSSYGTGTAQAKKSNAGIWVLIVVIVGLCIAVPTIILAVMFGRVKSVINNFQEITPEPGIEFDFGGDEDYWDEDYTYEEYIPSPSDKYYEEIVSSTVRGLSYDIAWNSSTIYPDDEDVMASFYYYYPVLIGSDAAFIDDINAEISRHALSYKAVSMEGDNYGSVNGYVTYMSEERLSVVFLCYYDENGVMKQYISALNFDMTTGEIIPIEDIIPQFEFVAEFRKTCELQNGYYSMLQLEEMTDEEIMEAITNPETGVAFYSPVGIDLGFNYPDGWMTVTMKFGTY